MIRHPRKSLERVVNAATGQSGEELLLPGRVAYMNRCPLFPDCSLITRKQEVGAPVTGLSLTFLFADDSPGKVKKRCIVDRGLSQDVNHHLITRFVSDAHDMGTRTN